MSGQPIIDVSPKAAQRGEPSYVWRAGQERRLAMIREWGGKRLKGTVLENGCGLGEYLARIGNEASFAVGLDIEFERLLTAKEKSKNLVCARGEYLPFAYGSFDLVVSNEVIEHVEDDQHSIKECIHVLKHNGRLTLFCPNRWYPFETHGIYWRGKYRFGNIPLVNYLPSILRNKLAPHVRAYTRREIGMLFNNLQAVVKYKTVIFGGYDNIIARRPTFGKIVRAVARFLKKTPIRALGLSHFWVVQKDSA